MKVIPILPSPESRGVPIAQCRGEHTPAAKQAETAA